MRHHGPPRPIKLDDLREYVRVVQGLSARRDDRVGETEGERSARSASSTPSFGLINIADPIPLRGSAFGPEGPASLTAELGAE